jgi:hypothetical protein
MLTNCLFETTLANSTFQAPFIGWALGKLLYTIHPHWVLSCWFYGHPKCAEENTEVQSSPLTQVIQLTSKGTKITTQLAPCQSHCLPSDILLSLATRLQIYIHKYKNVPAV